PDAGGQRDPRQRFRFRVAKETLGLGAIKQRHLRHAIEQLWGKRSQSLPPELFRGGERVANAPLGTARFSKPADLCDVGGLARPGRNRAFPGDDQQGLALAPTGGSRLSSRAVSKKALEHVAFRGLQRTLQVDKVDKVGFEVFDSRLEL